MEPTYWGSAPPMYPQFPPWGFNPWAPYPTGPAGYFQPGWIPPRPIFRPNVHEKRARFNEEARSHNAIEIRGGRSPVCSADRNNYKGDYKCVWMPVKRADTKTGKNVDDLDTAHGLKIA